MGKITSNSNILKLNKERRGNIALAVELKTLVSYFMRCTPGYYQVEASFSPFIFVPSKRNSEVVD